MKNTNGIFPINSHMHGIYCSLFRVFDYLAENFRWLAIQTDPQGMPKNFGGEPTEEMKAWARKYYGDD